MKWVKKGLIYVPEGKHGFDVTHCHKPTPCLINEDTIRVYFGTRDAQGKTRTTFIDLDRHNPRNIKYIHDRPVLDLGKLGTFDDCGANVSSLVWHNNVLLMYYIGWNPSTTVPTRNSIGLAVSYDRGITFKRLYEGPILDRNKEEPYYTGAVEVVKERSTWKMWYTSGTGWVIVHGSPEIRYHIKYAESYNGIDWRRENVHCIFPKNSIEVTARPCVIKDGNLYKMWYSRRDIVDFRTDKSHSYRAGYAISIDGLSWQRLDEKVGIDVSEKGWDQEALAYPYVLKLEDGLIMFYNGNGFGRMGFGYAKCSEE